MQVFHQGMRERGWVEGRNYVIENLYSDGKAERVTVIDDERARRQRRRRHREHSIGAHWVGDILYVSYRQICMKQMPIFVNFISEFNPMRSKADGIEE